MRQYEATISSTKPNSTPSGGWRRSRWEAEEGFAKAFVFFGFEDDYSGSSRPWLWAF